MLNACAVTVQKLLRKQKKYELCGLSGKKLYISAHEKETFILIKINLGLGLELIRVTVRIRLRNMIDFGFGLVTIERLNCP